MQYGKSPNDGHCYEKGELALASAAGEDWQNIVGRPLSLIK
jgi:hypothetical protein